MSALAGKLRIKKAGAIAPAFLFVIVLDECYYSSQIFLTSGNLSSLPMQNFLKKTTTAEKR
jgi:hypothetical protein